MGWIWPAGYTLLTVNTQGKHGFILGVFRRQKLDQCVGIIERYISAHFKGGLSAGDNCS